MEPTAQKGPSSSPQTNATPLANDIPSIIPPHSSTPPTHATPTPTHAEIGSLIGGAAHLSSQPPANTSLCSQSPTPACKTPTLTCTSPVPSHAGVGSPMPEATRLPSQPLTNKSPTPAHSPTPTHTTPLPSRSPSPPIQSPANTPSQAIHIFDTLDEDLSVGSKDSYGKHKQELHAKKMDKRERGQTTSPTTSEEDELAEEDCQDKWEVSAKRTAMSRSRQQKATKKKTLLSPDDGESDSLTTGKSCLGPLDPETKEAALAIRDE